MKILKSSYAETRQRTLDNIKRMINMIGAGAPIRAMAA